MADTQQAPTITPPASTPSSTQTSKNPFKKLVSYLQAQATNAANDRFEGSSYLTPRGKEPQQKYNYNYNRKKSRATGTETS